MSRHFKLVMVEPASEIPLGEELIIDYQLLHEQKMGLIALLRELRSAGRTGEVEKLEGIINLCDGIQDVGIHLGVPQAEVYPASFDHD